jgi:NADH dehydrogenase (ubiquinone) 1 beta subcomplex subunit 9
VNASVRHIPVEGESFACGASIYALELESDRQMGAAASMPKARAAAWEAGISHQQRVTRLYRASLRNSRDWIIDFDVFLVDARKIQKRFRENKDKSPEEGRQLVVAGMAELMEKRHPDPYIPIYAEGSSKYQRNVPPPPEARSSGCSGLKNDVFGRFFRCLEYR